jgi:hypothetical protein
MRRVLQGSLNSALRKRPVQPDGSVRVSKVEESAQLFSLGSSLGTLATFEGSVARFLARKLRRISKELTATNQKVGSSNLAAALSEAAARVSSARGARPPVKGNALKKKRPADAGDLRPEYKSTTRPPSAAGTTASQLREGANVAVLEPDVAHAFRSSSAGNEALRSLLRISETTRHLTRPATR